MSSQKRRKKNFENKNENKMKMKNIIRHHTTNLGLINESIDVPLNVHAKRRVGLKCIYPVGF